jgi:polar amino acid transport system substrate-binding protein
MAGAFAEDTLDKIKKRGHIIIGFANAPPWSEMTPEGKIQGATPEIGIAVLKRLGIQKVEAKISEFGALIPGLIAGRFDILTAGLLMNPARCEAVLYSEPDICATESFAVKTGNPFGLKSYEDVAKNKKVRIGVCGGCVQEGYARDAGIPSDRIVTIPDEQSAIKMLQAGRIDVYGYNTLSIVTLLRKAKDPNLEMVGPLEGIPIICAGACFRKSDRSFRDAYDKELRKLKESGEFDVIITKYGMSAKAARMVSRKELCGGEN